MTELVEKNFGPKPSPLMRQVTIHLPEKVYDRLAQEALGRGSAVSVKALVEMLFHAAYAVRVGVLHDHELEEALRIAARAYKEE